MLLFQVRVSRYGFNDTIGYWIHKGKNFTVHDEESYCQVGDKVVIRQCRKLSPMKHYYVRNIVLPIGRVNVTGKPGSKDEVNALKYNKKLREQVPRIYF